MGREPFFGRNAKSFFIQSAAAIILALTVAPYGGDLAVYIGCDLIGLCTTAASQR